MCWNDSFEFSSLDESFADRVLSPKRVLPTMNKKFVELKCD